MGLSGQASWLWTVTDRFLMISRLTNLYNTFKTDADGFLEGRRNWFNRTRASSSFTYFIENRLALSLSVRYSINYDGDITGQQVFDRRQSGLGFTADVRYYFSRNLY